ITRTSGVPADTVEPSLTSTSLSMLSAPVRSVSTRSLERTTTYGKNASVGTFAPTRISPLISWYRRTSTRPEIGDSSVAPTSAEIAAYARPLARYAAALTAGAGGAGTGVTTGASVAAGAGGALEAASVAAGSMTTGAADSTTIGSAGAAAAGRPTGGAEGSWRTAPPRRATPRRSPAALERKGRATVSHESGVAGRGSASSRGWGPNVRAKAQQCRVSCQAFVLVPLAGCRLRLPHRIAD